MSSLLSVLDVVDGLPGAVELRRRSYELLGDVRGRVIVDVGAGGGLAVAELGGLGARAVGVDVDPEMVAAARGRWGGHYRVGSAVELPFGDGEVAGYRADKVLHAVERPLDALREARRVLMPGGRVVLVGQDWDAIVVDSGDPELTRRVVRAKADTIASPWAARGYRNMVLDVGFVEPVVEVHTMVFTDEVAFPVVMGLVTEGFEGWVAEQRERAAAGRFFVAVPMFLVAARC